MSTHQNRIESGVPSAGQWTHTTRREPGCTPLGPLSAAAVLTNALDTRRNPSGIPWPAPPEYSLVEVWVTDDAACKVLEHHGFDGDVVENYQRTYASLDLHFDKEADFYGVKANGTEDLIAQGIREYEEAVNPEDHETLNYRDGYTDPMPPYLTAQQEVTADRLEASRELLHEAGISVTTEDARRGHFRLRSDSGDLRLEIHDYDLPKLIETRNWRVADAAQLNDFMGGPVLSGETRMFTLAATLVARDNRAHPENENWAPVEAPSTPVDEPEPEARVNGFSIEDVETYLQDEQHDDACACALKNGVCVTIGDNWRARTNIANVDAVFDALAALETRRE